MLNEVSNKLNIYYEINDDVINNYNNKKRNYETIYYLNQFKKNNILEELNKVIESYTLTEKFTNIFNIYRKMNIDTITLMYDTKDKKEIRIFGETFSERYKNQCKIIIEGNEQILKEKYNF